MGLKQICETALIEGGKIDISDCRYIDAAPQWPSYYHFLAGLVRTLGLKRALELGTYFGGSIAAMRSGLRPEDIGSSRLVTVDSAPKKSAALDKYPDIIRLRGDILDKSVISAAAGYFKESADILFIDAAHDYDHVKKNIYEYGRLIRPRFVILDDIRYNSSMRRLWIELARRHKDKVFDATDMLGRGGGVGFGIIEFGKDHDWDKYHGLRFSLLFCSAKIALRSFASALIPYRLKAFVRGEK